VTTECTRLLPVVRDKCKMGGVEEVGAMLTTSIGIEECAYRLADLHRMSRVMLRNRKCVIGGFADRTAKLIEIEMTAQEMELYRRVSAYVQEQYNLAQAEENRALGFVMATFQRLLASSSH